MKCSLQIFQLTIKIDFKANKYKYADCKYTNMMKNKYPSTICGQFL